MNNLSKKAPKDKIELYDKLIATNPNITRKGVTSPYTSHNGNMFSCLSTDGTLGLRLSKQERGRFLLKYKTTLLQQHGIVMKEYVTVPDALLHDTETLTPYLERSYAYVQTLKPKSTKRKKK